MESKQQDSRPEYKPTGEWTAAYLTDRWFVGVKSAKEIADAHNAAIAAEREKVAFQDAVIKQRTEGLQRQQDQLDAAVEALKEARENSPVATEKAIDAALARIGQQ